MLRNMIVIDWLILLADIGPSQVYRHVVHQSVLILKHFFKLGKKYLDK